MSNVTDKQKELLKQLNTNQVEIGVMIKDSIKKATDSGGILIELKALVKHGEWESWRNENISIAQAQCARYMLLSNNKDLLKSIPEYRYTSIQSACEYIADRKSNDAENKKIQDNFIKKSQAKNAKKAQGNIATANAEAVKSRSTRARNKAKKHKYVLSTLKQNKRIYELIASVETLYSDDELPGDLHDWLKQGREIMNGIESELSNAA